MRLDHDQGDLDEHRGAQWQAGDGEISLHFILLGVASTWFGLLLGGAAAFLLAGHVSPAVFVLLTSLAASCVGWFAREVLS